MWEGYRFADPLYVPLTGLVTNRFVGWVEQSDTYQALSHWPCAGCRLKAYKYFKKPGLHAL